MEQYNIVKKEQICWNTFVVTKGKNGTLAIPFHFSIRFLYQFSDQYGTIDTFLCKHSPAGCILLEQ